MSEWEFSIGDCVELIESAESGKVIGRAQFDYSENSFLVRYKAGDGRQVEQWHTASALRRA